MNIKRLISLSLAMAIVCPLVAFAKRAAPRDVSPVVAEGVRYVAVPWGVEFGEKQNGGFIEAREDRSGRVLWRLKVYTTTYHSDLEQDVQDVFIVSMRLDGEDLTVTDEQRRVYHVDVKTQTVQKA